MVNDRGLGGGIQLRRGLAPTGAKPNRFNSQQFSEPILSQGEINIDCTVDKHLGLKRSTAVKDQPRDHLMGTDLGDNLEHVDIRMGEPLLVHKGFITSNGFEKYFPKKSHVFSSVNGMYVLGKNRNMTQEDWENQFDFFGFSNGGVQFGLGKLSSMKVSSRLAGSGSSENTGHDELYIGDDVTWCLNSIDEATRNKELEGMPEVQYKPKEKMGVIWRRLDFHDATYYLQDALTLTFDPANDAYTNDFTVLTDSDRVHHLDSRVRVGMLMRALVSFASFNGIAHAIERGWVIPRTPADFTRDSWDTNYNSASWEDIEKKTPEELSQGMVVAGANRHELHYLDPSQVGDDQKRETTRAKQFLAAKHGFVGDIFGHGSITGSRSFLDVLTARTLRGMVLLKDVYDAGDISDMFHADPEEGTIFGGDKINTTYNLSTLIGNLQAIQGRVANDLYLTAVLALNKVRSKCVLKSLSHSIGGEKFNYLLKIH